MHDFIHRHIAYLKDNPKGYWFKRKLYGWGWTPATNEGWVIILVWIGVVILNGIRIESTAHPESDMLIQFVPQTLILVLILIAICYKTGEKPKWQWGFPKDETPTQD